VWPGDGHLASRKNPDRLKRGIYVDHTFVQNAFVDVDAVLRVLMIWPGRLTSIYLFNTSFLLRKVKDVTRTTISKPQSLTVTAVRIIDCTFRVPNKVLHHFAIRNNKSNLHSFVDCRHIFSFSQNKRHVFKNKAVSPDPHPSAQHIYRT